MAKITLVQHARKPRPGKASLRCGHCGCPIEPGMPYRHWSFRYGGKHVRCMAAACNPTAADLTSNEFQSRLLAMEHDFEEAISAYRESGDIDALCDSIESVAGEMRELGEEQGEKRDNMPEGLQQGDTGQLLDNRASECEQRADELDNLTDTARDAHDGYVDETDEAAVATWGEENDCTREEEDDETEEAFRERLLSEVRSFNAGIIDNVTNAVQEAIDFSVD